MASIISVTIMPMPNHSELEQTFKDVFSPGNFGPVAALAFKFLLNDFEIDSTRFIKDLERNKCSPCFVKTYSERLNTLMEKVKSVGMHSIEESNKEIADKLNEIRINRELPISDTFELQMLMNNVQQKIELLDNTVNVIHKQRMALASL